MQAACKAPSIVQHCQTLVACLLAALLTVKLHSGGWTGPGTRPGHFRDSYIEYLRPARHPAPTPARLYRQFRPIQTKFITYAPVHMHLSGQDRCCQMQLLSICSIDFSALYRIRIYLDQVLNLQDFKPCKLDFAWRTDQIKVYTELGSKCFIGAFVMDICNIQQSI